MQKRGSSPWSFFALTFFWTWLFWLVGVATGKTADTPPVSLLIVLGAVGPTASALILLYTRNDKTAQRDYWQRIFDVKRIGPLWWAVIALFTPLLTLVTVGLDAALGTGGTLDPTSDFLTGSVLTIASLAVFTLFFGPVPEDLGWRGYALERLQARHSPLISSLILGAIWATWHLPLFLIPGLYQNTLGLASLDFWRYMISILPEAVFITWIFNHTNRSTLAAILFHFVTNFNPVESVFVLSPTGQWVQLILRVLAAAAIAIWGLNNQAHEKPTQA